MNNRQYAKNKARAAALNYASEQLAQCSIEARGDQVFDDPDAYSASVISQAYIELENIASELKRRALKIERAL